MPEGGDTEQPGRQRQETTPPCAGLREVKAEVADVESRVGCCTPSEVDAGTRAHRFGERSRTHFARHPDVGS